MITHLQHCAQNLPNSAWYVDQRIGLVQDCESVLVTVHEPLLDLALADWEQKTEPSIFFCFEHCDAMLLCSVPNTRRSKELLRCNRCQAVEDIIDDPI
jgi:hypothetical protein